MSEGHTRKWWRGAVMYQIYPRSFCDSNNDGVGDLRGIANKLDYVADLGVDGIWICPFFPSPMKDFGYDVSDYRGVDPLFGTLDDFDALLEKAHALKLKVITDMVISHTSDRHPWFAESRASRTNPKADWYVWAPPRNDGTPPNNWLSVFGGSAWEFDVRRGQYYLHNFLKEQPDLNYHNPEVQDTILEECRFWLERGIDGFRLDVVNFYFHDAMLLDNPPRYGGVDFATQFEHPEPYSMQQHVYDKSRPENLGFLKRLRSLMDDYPGTMTLGEIGDDDPYALSALYTSGEDYLNTAYNTHMMSGTHKTLSTAVIAKPVKTFLEHPGESWPSWAFSNHDVVRAASRWHPDRSAYRHDPALSKMLIALLACLRGTAFLYQGEELGLPEADIPFDDIQDPWGKYLYPLWQGRDGCRTPMPWSGAEHAGFSKTNPWLPVPETHVLLNAAAQEQDGESVLNFTRRFLRWRKTQETLIEGAIEFQDTPETLLAFIRRHEDQTLLCIFNLTGERHNWLLPVQEAQEIFPDETQGVAGPSLSLPAYAFRIFRI